MFGDTDVNITDVNEFAEVFPVNCAMCIRQPLSSPCVWSLRICSTLMFLISYPYVSASTYNFFLV